MAEYGIDQGRCSSWVMCLVGSVLGAVNWTDGGADHLWCNPANWDGDLPDPEAWENAHIDIENMTHPLLITAGAESKQQTNNLIVGDW